MADYPISKEAVLRKLLDLKKSLGCRYISIGLDMALASFDGFPQMDAVPVVRCRECKYYNRALRLCNNGLGTRDFDYYCADGAKMDGGADNG